MGASRAAASATLHCLTGCAIGEVLGFIIGAAVGLSSGWTIALAVGLAFLFGYTLSILPLLRGGLAAGTALRVVLAADTLSIATMEVVDNGVMLLIPGAMEAGLANPLFWASMTFALAVAYLVAYPVNRFLLLRGKGHALVHRFHHGPGAHPEGWRRRIPDVRSATLAALIFAFMLGGFASAVGGVLEDGAEEGNHAEATLRGPGPGAVQQSHDRRRPPDLAAL
ncbi:DUF4396 domain-containing protein [Microbacterium ulmi]|uniref:DUF4396 domain-containing protein n=1 Tax=Microbacterium ulmi TaxID=179095 RepID=A0A7Y2Q164_9MICO|nr:DUF4396 domain-containing protein [Microbacterium ulmi]NII69519.1 hypothetical protein [Microbacterium ulmi]NNH05063.1 DUF4396 domain-containing protein [Microbacterium ulmi]